MFFAVLSAKKKKSLSLLKISYGLRSTKRSIAFEIIPL